MLAWGHMGKVQWPDTRMTGGKPNQPKHLETSPAYAFPVFTYANHLCQYVYVVIYLCYDILMYHNEVLRYAIFILYR